jgi:hypothetical protein
MELIHPRALRDENGKTIMITDWVKVHNEIRWRMANALEYVRFNGGEVKPRHTFLIITNIAVASVIQETTGFDRAPEPTLHSQFHEIGVYDGAQVVVNSALTMSDNAVTIVRLRNGKATQNILDYMTFHIIAPSRMLI